MANTPDKLAKKRALLVSRTAQILGVDKAEASGLLRIGRKQSVRCNPLHANIQNARDHLAQAGHAFSWCSDGYAVEAIDDALRQFADDGAVYIQNAASWLPVIALDPRDGEKVLDMCAAPGGKTSHMAALMGDEAIITANDNSRARLMKLKANLKRLGAGDVETTLFDAQQLSRHLPPESFDKILLDAPCSGEGMMQLDNQKDFESWSLAHIKRLSVLQRRLIREAWQLLKPGGTLVYSTCTMAPEENEAVVNYLLKHEESAVVEPLDFRAHLPNASPSVQSWNNKYYHETVARTLRLQPSPDIEAFFVAKIRKRSDII